MILEYRLAPSGKSFPNGNLGANTDVETEKDCYDLCKVNPQCVAFAFYWAGDLSLTGSCILKQQLDLDVDAFTGDFVTRWKGSKNIYTNKGRQSNCI